MPTFNAELSAKAQEKRLDAVEKLARELSAKFDQNDTAAVLKKTTQDLTGKLDAIEAVVRGIVESRGESKVQALEKLVKLVHEKMPKEAEIQKKIDEAWERDRQLRESKRYVTTDESANMIQEEIRKVWDSVQESRRQLQQEQDNNLQKKLDEAINRQYAIEWKKREQEGEEKAERLRRKQEEVIARSMSESEKKVREAIDEKVRLQINDLHQRISIEFQALVQVTDAIQKRLSALESKH